MNSSQIKALRDAGNFQAAIEQGLPHIADFKVLIQVNWAYYGLIKQQVTQTLHQSQLPANLIQRIYDTAYAYTKLPNRRADSSLSNILRELSKIAPYSPNYLEFIYWVLQVNGIQDSDWQATEFQGKRYSPLVCNIARSLAKWANRFSQYAKPEDLGKHTEAAQVLASVLKAKRNEFWVWQEAGRLYANEQPDLALSCYCRALECKAKTEFTVKVHTELAMLLATLGETTWATAEILEVLDIRQKQNWKIGEDLQRIMSESWYNPTAELPDRASLYAQYSSDALKLCFDNVHEQPASFAGILELPPSPNLPYKKAKCLAKFIIQTQKNKAISILSTDNKTVSDWKPGTPAILTLGSTENTPNTIMHIAPRMDGALWDCTQQSFGLVQDVQKDCFWVFLNRHEQIKILLKNWQGEKPQLGTYVQLFTAVNPKKNHVEVLLAKTCKQREMNDVKVVSGNLKHHDKGFAFIKDIFIPSYLLSTMANDVRKVEVVAIFTRNPKKLEYGWRAVSLSSILNIV